MDNWEIMLVHDFVSPVQTKGSISHLAHKLFSRKISNCEEKTQLIILLQEMIAIEREKNRNHQKMHDIIMQIHYTKFDTCDISE